MKNIKKLNRKKNIAFQVLTGFGFLLNSILMNGQESQILLKTNFEGKVIEGSLKSLIENIEKGERIRIGWQLDFDNDKIPDLEHWIDGNFLTILNGQVFNQIDPIYGQLPLSEIPQVQIDNSPLQWTAIIGTNGKLISRFIHPGLDKIEDEIERKEMEKMTQIYEQMVSTIWSKD